MKNLQILVLAVFAVGIVAFGFTGNVQAEELTPVLPGNGAGMGGNGGNGRGGSNGTGVPLDMNINLDGAIDDVMAGLIADALGISVEDLQAREAAGETLVEIGLSLGFDADEVIAIHDQARADALAQAVTSGLITQEEADWLLSRMSFGQNGVSLGLCDGDCTTSTMTQTHNKFHNGDTRGSRWSN
ncbi:MAG: hypothetical protein P8046_04985 [Anaerolineales bacterium]